MKSLTFWIQGSLQHLSPGWGMAAEELLIQLSKSKFQPSGKYWAKRIHNRRSRVSWNSQTCASMTETVLPSTSAASGLYTHATVLLYQMLEDISIYSLFCSTWIQTPWRTRIRALVLYIHSSYRKEDRNKAQIQSSFITVIFSQK